MKSTQNGQSQRMSLGGSPAETTPSAPSLDDLLAETSLWSHQGEGGKVQVLQLGPRALPRGVCSTLNTSACPNDANVSSSLQDVLEAGPIPSRYFLSAKACEGILRRAERRGKKLPVPIEEALRRVVQGGK